ncbi:MAG: fumarylacetoacetate hydrolase family protein [Solirubrobacteraceae bacterium]|nr:fumarylacetoacetate hydrolase family protein [Solirubrobacteraceae bacterium]
MDYYLATIRRNDRDAAALVLGGRVHPLPGQPSCADVLRDWPAWKECLAALAAGAERLAPGLAIDDVVLRAPVPHPTNLYMVGANYADHGVEMGSDAFVAARPPEGPFMFLRPTTSVIGPRDPVCIEDGSDQMDWEVELGVVIGRRGHRIAAHEAREYVAGYTVVNDISDRGRFERTTPVPPFKWDWFLQKGWNTTCPMGPWLIPAECCPNPDDLAISLSVNGVVEQSSNTTRMLFSIEEQIAHVSAVVPLQPGDIICTGTPAGVGIAKRRFLAPGDVVVAEIEGIGRLENTVVRSAPDSAVALRAQAEASPVAGA